MGLVLLQVNSLAPMQQWKQRGSAEGICLASVYDVFNYQQKGILFGQEVPILFLTWSHGRWSNVSSSIGTSTAMDFMLHRSCTAWRQLFLHDPMAAA